MMYGIYVREPYATAIVKGQKPIETRTRDMLKRFVGKRVFIIATYGGKKPAEVIGRADILSKEFRTAEELDAMRDETLIPVGDKYDCTGKGKWCYRLKAEPFYGCYRSYPLSYFPVTMHTRTYVKIEYPED